MMTPDQLTPGQMTAGITGRLNRPHSDEDTAGAAALAAEVVRYLNYATGAHAGDGLTEPATAHAVLGDLAMAAARHGQLAWQIAGFLSGELAAGRLGHDEGADVAAAVSLARVSLALAADTADALSAALSRAQADLSHLYRGGAAGSPS
jgi:hypothetical protein